MSETTIRLDDPDVDLKVTEAAEVLRVELDAAGRTEQPVEVFLDPDKGVCTVRAMPAPPDQQGG